MWMSLYLAGITIGYVGQVAFWLYEKVRAKKLLFKMAQDKTLGKNKMTPSEIRKWLSHHNRYSECWYDHGHCGYSGWESPVSDWVTWIGLLIGPVFWPIVVMSIAIFVAIGWLEKLIQQRQQHLANQVNAVLDGTASISQASISQVHMTGSEEAEKGLSLVQR